jgi:hypothetical protein
MDKEIYVYDNEHASARAFEARQAAKRPTA